MDSQSGPRARLTLLGVSHGRSFFVELSEGEPVWVGRGREATLRVEDDRLAPLHLCVRATGDGAHVSIEPKAGGVQLNEVEFSGTARMKVGDQLNAGDTVLILQRVSPPPAPAAPRVRARREFAERLEEEVQRASATHRAVLFALVRVRSARGFRPEALATWQQEMGARVVVGELGAETVQVVLVEPAAGEAARLLDGFPKGMRGERPQVGHALFPEDGSDADALMEVALARMTPGEDLPAGAVDEPLFVDPVMVRLVSVLDALAPLPSPLLLRGERGVGKELVASLLHQRSGRAGPLVKVDAAAFTPAQLNAELFGADDGRRVRPGAVERAAKGTLLIAHAERLSAELQASLLKSGQPVAVKGAARTARPGARWVLTWQDGPVADEEAPLLRHLTSSLRVPALRDRRADVLPLAEHFLSRCRKRHGRPRLVLGQEVRALLPEADWPGNLRQLRNAIEAAVLVSESDEIRPDDLPPDVQDEAPATKRARGPAGRTDFRTSLNAVEKDVLLKALATTRWNVSRAAKELGLPRRTVVYRMARLGLRRPER